MRWSWNPSIEPTRNDHKVYLVVDGFGHNGRIFVRGTSKPLSLI